jgi:hypothetical protein
VDVDFSQSHCLGAEVEICFESLFFPNLFVTKGMNTKKSKISERTRSPILANIPIIKIKGQGKISKVDSEKRSAHQDRECLL